LVGKKETIRGGGLQFSPSTLTSGLPRGIVRLAIEADEGLVKDFLYIFQKGFCLETARSATVRSILSATLGLSADYVARRVTTIFLDGKPVDNLDTPVHDRATLSLSGAMPGLVGAAMRVGGPLSGMRVSISFASTGITEGSGTIRVKLFNVVLHDVGRNLLAAGILVERSAFLETMERLSVRWWERCTQITFNGKRVGALPSPHLLIPDGTACLFLSVTADRDDPRCP
jgi:hypothetical protein